MDEDAIRSLFGSVDWSHTDWTKEDGALADNVLSLLGDLPGRRILDLACGSASLGVELAGRGYDVVGLDLCLEPARQRAAARHVQLEFVEQDMSEMTYHDAFDAVVNWDVSGIGMQSTDDGVVDVVKRVTNALVPGGKILIETYNPLFARRHGIEMLRYDSERNRFVGTLTRLTRDGTSRAWDLSLRLFSSEEWQRVLTCVGLEVLGLWGSLSGDPLMPDSRMLAVVAEKPRG